MLSCPSCSFSNNEQARLCGYCGLYLRPIGDYVLQEQIGVGGFAEVYRAVNRYTGHPAAIKFLHRKLIDDKEVEQRFLREVEILRDLHSPNIVQIYDFGILEDIGLYLVMEWIDGETLDVYMQRQPEGRLPQMEALQLFSQLLYGLSRIHEQRVVHRDLKPKNFMIIQDQGQSVLKILDFGIAWVAGRQALTERGMFVGSTYFMAPEQFRAQKELFGPSTDLYVAGLLLGWMLTGKHVFTGNSIKDLAIQHCYNMPPMLSELCPEEHFLPALEAVVTYSLQKEPHRRFQSSMEFLEALNNPLEFQRQFLSRGKEGGGKSSTVALGAASGQTPLPETGKKPAVQTQSYRASSSQVVRQRQDNASSVAGALHVLQNKKTQPLTHLSDALGSERAKISNNPGLLEGEAAVGLDGVGSVSLSNHASSALYPKEETHADVLVKDKREQSLHENTDMQQTPSAGLPAPSSAPEGAPPNAGPSSPPVEIEAGEMRVLSDMIASWPTKIEMQPQMYHRPLKHSIAPPVESPPSRAWLWVTLFFLSSAGGLGWYLFQQNDWVQPSKPKAVTKPAKENLPLRSIHDQDVRQKTNTNEHKAKDKAKDSRKEKMIAPKTAEKKTVVVPKAKITQAKKPKKRIARSRSAKRSKRSRSRRKYRTKKSRRVRKSRKPRKSRHSRKKQRRQRSGRRYANR